MAKSEGRTLKWDRFTETDRGIGIVLVFNINYVNYGISNLDLVKAHNMESEFPCRNNIDACWCYLLEIVDNITQIIDFNFLYMIRLNRPTSI